ncbi:MAG: acyl-CoA thioesterase [Sphingobacteriia bacterium]|nr:MAG: acyl-CoA thioesterase [Sphingobacteriia bacterium]TAG32047.1 MAG: acyl-CoA thioesterase [Sphingobacteriia bacterium]TAH06821.1 MAG: acyl-CoA thioesterase [Sphingobacteriia bacterium]
MYEYNTMVRVRYAETDQMNIVYYGNYAQYFEVGRAEWIRSLGYTYKKMEEMGIRMPVVKMEVKFLRPAQYDELITIKTILKELPAEHEIAFHHEVYNEKEKLLTTGKVTLYFISVATGKRTAMPANLKLSLTPFFSDDHTS